MFIKRIQPVPQPPPLKFEISMTAAELEVMVFELDATHSVITPTSQISGNRRHLLRSVSRFIDLLRDEAASPL